MAGRVALVTGASSGIGRACAIALAEAGHRVVVAYSGNEEGGKLTAKQCPDSVLVQVDVGDPASVDALFDAAESAAGPVEILVNNAGITRDGLLMRMGDDQ